jgi:hypothetical protein
MFQKVFLYDKFKHFPVILNKSCSVVELRANELLDFQTKYPTELKLSRMLMYCHVELYRNLAYFLKIMVRFL